MKLELHAFVILGVGAALVLCGHVPEGQLVIGGALALFKATKS